MFSYLIPIKDLRENAGVLDALAKAGIVKDMGKVVRMGYELVYLCRTLTLIFCKL